VEFEGTVEISAYGIVSVSAKDMETGLKQAITVTATSGLTEDEIRKMVEESRDYLIDQKQNEEFEGKKQAAEKLIEEIEGLFPRVEGAIAGSDFGQDALKKARNVIERARSAIGARDLAQVGDSTEALNRTLNMFKGVVAKTRVG
jgi:molecular chaperone DnaK